MEGARLPNGAPSNHATVVLQTVAGQSDSLQDPEGCYQRMLQWLDGRDENKNATLLAMVLGMTISSSLVASGLAVWLCGVGWRAAHGPGAQSTCQPAVEREDHRNHATCPRTRNPQRKGRVSWAKLTYLRSRCGPDPKRATYSRRRRALPSLRRYARRRGSGAGPPSGPHDGRR